MGHNRNLADYAHHFDGTNIDLGSGNIETEGVVTYEDVTNVDAIGIVTARAGVKVPDNQKVFLGTGDDFQIYHNGTDTHLRRPSGSSSFYISADHTVRITNAAQSQDKAKFVSGGAVELYHNDAKKLETTVDGIDVSGEVQCDSLDVDGVADFTGKVDVNNELHTHRTTTTASNALLALHSDIGGTKTRKATVRADGSAEFAGTITAQANAVAEIGTLTSAATITPDFATHCNFTVTLGHNATIANPSNLTAGQSGSIFLVQDSTGSRTASWGTYWDFAGGSAPTLTTAGGSVDRIDYIVRSSTSIHAVATLNYS